MKNELRPGETIDLLIPDVLVNYGSGENGNLSVELADETWLFIPSAMARVTRRVPADGVPQPGDVWRDRFGGVWFARADGYGNPTFVSQENRPYCSWQGVNEDCGPIELLYRPGDDSTPPPTLAGPDPSTPGPASPNVAPGGEEVAGSAWAAGPATAPENSPAASVASAGEGGPGRLPGTATWVDEDAFVTPPTAEQVS